MVIYAFDVREKNHDVFPHWMHNLSCWNDIIESFVPENVFHQFSSYSKQTTYLGDELSFWKFLIFFFFLIFFIILFYFILNEWQKLEESF